MANTLNSIHLNNKSSFVIPAQAGIHLSKFTLLVVTLIDNDSK
jgi:hypothetical protein